MESRRKLQKNSTQLNSNYEFTGKTKYGRKVNLKVNVSRIIIEDEEYLLGIYEDITEAKKINSALKQAEEK
ncbi:PAS domain S-box protein [Melioribacteraceae bacterium 4301-Me]|uniref:PAS domain S-box protein n=1 Tax=Pyranulibacter aquaticus TaxID=3163344 RepID=UPI00359A7686